MSRSARVSGRVLPVLVAMLGMVLVGCKTPGTRDVPLLSEPETSSTPEATADVAPKAATETQAQVAGKDNVSGEAARNIPFWQRIVAGYEFADCGRADARLQRWQRIYTQSPQRHAAAIAKVLPLMAYVAEQLEQRKLPTEFVWLPYVESSYVAFRTSGDRPAGAWQMMPATARWRGLKIDHNYDGRLDFVAATRAALDLIEHLATVFDRNWLLVTMAYNAGEFRIRKAVAKSPAMSTPWGVESLPVSAITHEHLTKLRALACSAAQAESQGWTLPDVDASSRLVATTLGQSMPARQIAALAGVSLDDWLQWNPAWRSGAVAAGAEVLMPERLAERAIAAWAAATPEPVAKTEPADASATTVHVVRAGESAWLIARKYRVALASLLAVNGLGQRSILRPGMKLRLP